MVLAGLGYVYILYIIHTGRTRTGWVTMSVLVGGVVLAAIVVGLSVIEVAVLVTGLVWIVRSLYRYSGIVSSLIDGVMCAIALSGALMVFAISGSLVIAIWSYLLVQALHAVLPESLFGQRPIVAYSEETRAPNDRFWQAHRAAEEALHQLAAE